MKILLLAPRLHPPHAAKTMQSRMMFSDRLLMSMPYEIETHNFGNVDSIANVIFLAVISSIYHAFQEKPWETRVLMKENSACLSAQARADLPRNISTSQSRVSTTFYSRQSLAMDALSATIGPSSGECRLKRRVAHPGIADEEPRS